MRKLIVAFGNDNNRNRIAEILESGGYTTIVLCKSGKEAIRIAKGGGKSIIICAYKLADMTADDLAYDIGEAAAVIAVGKPTMLDMCENDSIFKLPTPLKKQDLFNAVELLVSLGRERDRAVQAERSESDKMLIAQAKAVLMEKCGMTEPEAHRFVQKKSMDAGLKMSTTARIIVNTYN